MTKTLLSPEEIEILRDAIAENKDSDVIRSILDKLDDSIPVNIEGLPPIPCVQWHTEGNKVGVETPYHADFVKKLKSVIPAASFKDKVWYVSRKHLDPLIAVVQEYFSGEAKRVRIAITMEGYQPFTVDGKTMTRFKRGGWAWDTRNMDSVVIISESLSAGGSAKYPKLVGSCVIEMDVVNESLVSGGSYEVTIL